MLNISRNEIDRLWEQGYRPWEIYTKNSEPVYYLGTSHSAGELDGWDITHIFAKRAELKLYPFFDTVIGMSCVTDCVEVWSNQAEAEA